MNTDLNNAVLKALVNGLQSKVDDLEAENKSLREGSLPERDAVETKDLLYKIQDARAELFEVNKDLRKENDILHKSVQESSRAVKSMKHSFDHAFKERDKLVEENGKLLKDNTKLATRVRKIESGNFDEYFTYTTPPITLTPGGSAVVNIAITREADFYVTKIVRAATGPFAFLVRDSSNDRQWSNIPLHSDLGAGTAQLPLILPKPRFVARASNITIELTDLTCMANEVRLALIGYKIYHIENLYHATGEEKKKV